MARGKRYFFRDGEYTAAEIAKMTGIPVKMLRSRIKNGVSIERSVAMGANGHAHRCKLHPYHGEMLSISEIAKRSGIMERTIRDRTSRGWTVEEAADTPIDGRRVYIRPGESSEMEHVKGMSPEEASRCLAARKISRDIASGNLTEWNFRCIVPMTEYAFDGDILGWRIRFAPDGKTAQLTAKYRSKDINSDFRRTYRVHGDTIKEVQEPWTP